MTPSLKLLKLIAVVAAVIGIVGLAAELIPVFINIAYDSKINLFALRPIELCFIPFLGLEENFYGYSGGLVERSSNTLNLMLNALLVVGALRFATSGCKESRLLRFSLSLVFLSSLIMMVTLLSGFNVIMLVNVLYAAFALFSLKMISKTQTLDCYSTNEYGRCNEFVKAPTSSRVIHHLTDTVLCFALLLPMLIFLQKEYNIEKYTFTLVLALAAVRFIFYFVSESTLGGTPAKFLTGTRTLEEDDDTLSVGAAFKRSACRVVPFDAMSFLFDGRWHDRWSETYVGCEKQGSARKDVLLLAIVALVSAGFFLVVTYSNESERNDHWDNYIKYEADGIWARIERADSTAILVLTDRKCFRVKRATKDSVIGSFVCDNYSRSIKEMDEMCNFDYAEGEDVSIAKSEIYESLYHVVKDSGVLYSINIGDETYKMTQCAFIGEPLFDPQPSNSVLKGDTIRIVYVNRGWEFDNMEFRPVSEDVQWIGAEYNDPHLTIKLKYNGRKNKYQALVLDKRKNRTIKYLLQGEATRAFMTEVSE